MSRAATYPEAVVYVGGAPVLTKSANRGRAASEAFTKALLDLGAGGLRTHCSDPDSRHMWLSESAAERAEAAKLCRGCPVILECGQAATARKERWGVWAGVDRSPRAKRRADAA